MHWILKGITIAGALVSACASPAATLVIDTAQERQRIDGFGASSAWYIDEMWQLQGDAREAFVRAIFDPVDGLGVSIHRLKLYNSPATGNPEYPYDWTHEKLGMEGRMTHLIQDRYDPVLMLTPWSPPSGMKEPAVSNGGSLPPSSYAACAAVYPPASYRGRAPTPG